MKSRVLAATALVLLVSPAMFGQAKSAKPHASAADRDQLGMTCAQILVMSSSDWIAQFNEKAGDAAPTQQKTVRAIAAYGKCYDARTDRLAAALGRKRAGPLMGARGNFRDFEQALENFRTKALAVNDPPPDAVKTAYAALYAKQFRYEFYQASETPTEKPEAMKSGSAKTAAAKPPAPATQKADVPTKVADAPADNTGQATPDADPMTTAKNRFGQLLDALPDEKMHELHSSFGDIVSRGEMSEEARLAVYRYAIFLLEPASAQPFSPPPF
jgi:hypothetical protein